MTALASIGLTRACAVFLFSATDEQCLLVDRLMSSVFFIDQLISSVFFLLID
jgi:hypothetical protein